MYTLSTMPIQIPKTEAKTEKVAFRFSPTFKRLLDAIAANQKVSQTAVVEFAVEELAKKLKIAAPVNDEGKHPTDHPASARPPADRTGDDRGEYRAEGE